MLKLLTSHEGGDRPFGGCTETLVYLSIQTF